MSLINESAVSLRDRIARGELTAEAVTAAFCDRIEATEPRLDAFLHYSREAALAQAAALDRKRTAGAPLGPLGGVPVGIKDLICQRGVPATCASRILEGFVPPYDATVIERLQAAGAVLVGRLNMDEFAMGSSTENSGFKVTRNPWDTSRIPGGSSGGSAAAVASRQLPLALGTDTGGSIRQPAALCGITGLKPSYGRVSRFGLIAYASSLDQIGPMAGSVDDAALLLQALAGHDPRDATSADTPVPDYRAGFSGSLKGVRIGLAAEHFGEGLDPAVEQAVRQAVDVFRDLGAVIQSVHLPHAPYGIATYYLVATAEASSNLARYDGVHYGRRAATYSGMVDMYCATRGELFGDEVKRRIMLGTFALSAGYRDAYYVKALKVRRLLKQDYDKAFEQVDVILGPTTPTPAFRLGEKVDDPLAMYLNDIYTVSANLTGITGMSLPCGFSTAGLPMGMQLQGPAFAEDRVLQIGYAYQQVTDWHTRRPTL